MPRVPRSILLVLLCACGSTASDDRESVPAEPTPIRLLERPSSGSEVGAGAGGMQQAEGACARQAEAMGQALGATATVTGLPPRDSASEEIARVQCQPDESDDACSARVEGAARAEHGMAANLEFELAGERRRVRAVVLLDGARMERTFDDVEALETFVSLQRDAGKQVQLEQMLAEIDPASRAVVVRRTRPIAPGDRRGRAQLIVPGNSAETMQRVTDTAREHRLTIEDVSPLDGSFQVTVECQ